jgi:PKD repeat protein
MQTVNVTVAASFTASVAVTPSSVTTGASVTATISSNSGTIASSQISWGDGSTSPGPSASHAYSQTGSYTVTATATSSLGATSQATAGVTVSAPAPPASLTVTQPTNGATLYAPIHVVAGGSAPSGVDAMQIYLDGALVYQINATSFDTTVPASNGTHAVVVKLWDKLGNAYKQSVTVNVIPRLVTSFSLSASSIAPGGSVQATLSATSGTIGSSFISWGDGTTSAGPSATHTYATAGTYTITGTAADAVASTTATATLTVQKKAFVVMQSPTQNSNVSTSVHVQGYAGSPSGIVAMQIYLDGNLIYRNALSQVDTFINVSIGTHRITLKAWDGSGAAYMQQANVTAN